MKTYRCLLFDLFSTVALWHPERMPQLDHGGKVQPSTLGLLADLLTARHPHIAFDDFHAAVTLTNERLQAERHASGREIPSAERFRRTLLELGLPAGPATSDLATALSHRHMALLRDASAIPPAHRALLARLAERYPLALVSNFDHAPTALEVLQRDGAEPCFRHILVSDAHGWRKPHPRIFTDALALLGCAPGEALFIGDSVDDDLVGAHAVGLDVAWINARGAALPAGAPTPAFTISAITELDALLR